MSAVEEAPWIDARWLLEGEFPDGVCCICLGVMINPVIGCQKGHSFCRTCCRTLVDDRESCPLCRNSLFRDPVPNLLADNLIGQLSIRCKHGRDDSEVVRFTEGELTPAEWMTNEDLERCGVPLSSTGNDIDYCSWSGKVSELLGHWQTTCPFEQVSCPNEGCSEKILRKHLAEHDEKCGFCKVVDGLGLDVAEPAHRLLWFDALEHMFVRSIEFVRSIDHMADALEHVFRGTITCSWLEVLVLVLVLVYVALALVYGALEQVQRDLLQRDDYQGE